MGSIYASSGEAFIIPGSVSGGEWVKLNVGGQVFFTSKTTLLNGEPESMLAKMFRPGSGFQPGATDSQGSFFIDQDPSYFGPILNYFANRKSYSGSKRQSQSYILLSADLFKIITHSLHSLYLGVLEERIFFGIPFHFWRNCLVRKMKLLDTESSRHCFNWDT